MDHRERAGRQSQKLVDFLSKPERAAIKRGLLFAAATRRGLIGPDMMSFSAQYIISCNQTTESGEPASRCDFTFSRLRNIFCISRGARPGADQGHLVMQMAQPSASPK